MNYPRVTRSLLVLIGVLLLFSGGFAGPAGAQTVVVNSVAQLEAALAAAAAGTGPTDIRIAKGTYGIASPLFLDAPAGVTVTLQNAGDGRVILQSTSGGDILRTGWNSSDHGGLGPFPGFVVRGLTFSGADNAINSAVGTILVADCTFVDNNLGFYIDFSRGTVTFVNDTFTQNGGACPQNFFCGGMRFDSHRSSTATNITVVGNQPQGVHGLGVLRNSIVTGNTAPLGTRGADCFDRPQSVLSSIDSDGTCGPTTVDPKLAALADNGGLVQTMALPATSPAVNAGNNSVCPLTDARGAFRGDGACDIGAFERSQAFQAESVTGAGPVAFSTEVGAFTEFHVVDPTTLPPLPGVTFPFGLFEWTIIELTPGATARVIIQFPSPVPVPPQYWKFNPGTGLWTNVCLLLPCVVDPSSPNLLQLTITDGGPGDLDGSVNGMIRDPGGLGVSEGRPPVARCKDVTVSTSPGMCSAVSASVDDGSPGAVAGDTITLTQTPGGPYGLGATAVVLTVTDSHGASSQCTARVTVVDTERPAITCPAPITKACAGPPGANATPVASATDNCGAVTASCSPAGPFPLGTTTVSCTATDTAGNQSSCNTAVEIVDTTRPVVTCVEGVNPAGKNIPPAGTTLPGAKGGQNPDGFYRVAATDFCDPGPKISLGGVTLANGETIKLTQSPAKSGVALLNTMGPLAIKHFQVGPGDAVITATDASRNTATVTCLVPPPPR